MTFGGEQPAGPRTPITILSLSPGVEDHQVLAEFFPSPEWTVLAADCLPPAVSSFQQNEIAVVVCERDLAQASWVDVLGQVQLWPNPPSLIVTSRFADNIFWVEALNLGAWDVLAKPLARRELVRSVKSAWEHRQNRLRSGAESGAVPGSAHPHSGPQCVRKVGSSSAGF